MKNLSRISIKWRTEARSTKWLNSIERETMFVKCYYLNEKICRWRDGDTVVIQFISVICIRINFRQRFVLARKNTVTDPDFLRLLWTPRWRNKVKEWLTIDVFKIMEKVNKNHTVQEMLMNNSKSNAKEVFEPANWPVVELLRTIVPQLPVESVKGIQVRDNLPTRSWIIIKGFIVR